MSDGVVIVGGGLAAQRCAETLRRGGHRGRVRLVCGELHAPYDRPPLSKELLSATGECELPAFRPRDWYGEHDVEVLLGVKACALDPGQRLLALADGRELGYEQLVVATGACPRTLPLFDGYANVSTLRTFEDSQTIRALLEHGAHLVVIGAGFIGLEVAAAARTAGAQVSVVELETLPLAGLLGPQTGRWLADLHASAGADLLLGREVTAVAGANTIESVTLSDGRVLECDHVLVGVGIRPDVAWLASAGLPGSGIPTDLAGRTELRHVYAAGDCAATYNPVLERHALSGHWEAASRQGGQVANTILGREVSPPQPASFWSDQYGLRIQYLGHAPLADSVTIDGDQAANDFVASYTREGELVAAVVVGRPRAVAELRARLSPNNERTAA